MPKELVIELHAVNPTTGHWCDHCALPSVVAFDIIGADGETLRHMGRLGTYRQCLDCGATPYSIGEDR